MEEYKKLDGILLVDKPAGLSSFGVVSKVRGVWRQELREQGVSIKKAKVGHTGTLDPFATGLLILVLGSYCKRAGEFSKLDKSYAVEAILGKKSTTGDPEGEITDINASVPSISAVSATLESFVGQISQVPPIYSAIKVDGQRAYKLAREGKSVEMAAREVTIKSISSVEYKYPLLKFTVDVSSGTYIRTLVEDIGDKLGTGAYTSNLRRLSVGDYKISDSCELEGLDLVKLEQRLVQLLPITDESAKIKLN